VFVGSKRGADRLRADLAQRVGASSAVVAIHGDLDQARAPLPLPLPLPPLAREGS
jgi:superfamily II DNA/RNA helicase